MMQMVVWTQEWRGRGGRGGGRNNTLLTYLVDFFLVLLILPLGKKPPHWSVLGLKVLKNTNLVISK